MDTKKGLLLALAGVALIATSLFGANAEAASDKAAKRKAVIDFWTAEQRAAAQPREMLIDHRGLGYLRRVDGSLQPYGHQVAAGQSALGANPANDVDGPDISAMDPTDITIGSAYTFSAVVTDPSGLRSVKFVVTKEGGRPQSFTPSASGDTYSVSLSGFTDGNWSWEVEAKDASKGGGNRSSRTASFSVDTSGGGGGGGGGGGDGDTVTNAVYDASGQDIQYATGRLYYQMPTQRNLRRWASYVCSGTVVTENGSGRSLILTASHCVYDDANKAFARNVLFIPDQHNTSGSGSDTNCSNDPIGCWVADFGVVDVNWTTRTFPDNVAWDYGFYVVDNVGAHTAGENSAPDALQDAVTEFSINWNTAASFDDGTPGAASSDFTHAMGYSYSDDPNFMYCAEDMQNMDNANWWIPSCGLSGGSSGGPWLQPFDGSTAGSDIISVNSWGYTSSPGMAGPKLYGTSAHCVFSAAETQPFDNFADGDAGYAITCSQ